MSVHYSMLDSVETVLRPLGLTSGSVAATAVAFELSSASAHQNKFKVVKEGSNATLALQMIPNN